MQLSLTSAVVAFAPAQVGGGGNDGQSLPVLPHTGELVFGTILFLIFLFLIWKFALPKLESAYTQRVDAIEGDMSRAENALAEAEALKAEYHAKLNEARTEANRMREQGRADGAAIVAEMREQANAEAARIIDSAHRQIEAERAAAAAELRGEVGRLSTDLASRIVGESLHEETRQKGIVERFLADLDNGSLERELGSDKGAQLR